MTLQFKIVIMIIPANNIGILEQDIFPREGLRNYWRFDGDSTDTMGNRNLTGTTVSYNNTGLTKHLQYGLFGNQGVFEAAGSTDTYFRDQVFSFGGWVYYGPSASNFIIWSHDYTSHSAPYYCQHLRYYSNSYTYYTNRNGSVAGWDYTWYPSNHRNEWHHVFVTQTTTRFRQYMDGNMLNENTTHTGNVTYYNRQTWIGASPNLSRTSYNAYTSRIDAFGYWTVELSERQVKDLYNLGTGIYY